jgi:hypothetical protein
MPWIRLSSRDVFRPTLSVLGQNINGYSVAQRYRGGVAASGSDAPTAGVTFSTGSEHEQKHYTR